MCWVWKIIIFFIIFFLYLSCNLQFFSPFFVFWSVVKFHTAYKLEREIEFSPEWNLIVLAKKKEWREWNSSTYLIDHRVLWISIKFVIFLVMVPTICLYTIRRFCYQIISEMNWKHSEMLCRIKFIFLPKLKHLIWNIQKFFFDFFLCSIHIFPWHPRLQLWLFSRELCSRCASASED